MAAAGVMHSQQLAPTSTIEHLGGLKANSSLQRSFLTTPGGGGMGVSQTPVHGPPGSSSGLMSSSSSHKRAKFKLEPLKVLEPSQKKLTLPESQRIMYILEELIHRLETLDLISLIVSNKQKSRDLFWQSLTDDEKRRNADHGFLAMCEHHKSLVNALSEDASSMTAHNKANLEALLKNSCKDILRVLQSKPGFYESLKQEFASKLVKKQSPQILELISLLNEVKEIMHEKLLTTPHEQREKTEYLKELLIREKANNELIRKLKDEQAQANSEKDEEVKQKNDQIRKLDNDLKNVERFSNDLIKRTKNDAEQQEASESKASEGRKAKLQQELNQLRQQFQGLVHEHREQENLLRKEKWKHETNVEGLLGRYDDDMIKKQSEYDEIEAMYEEELKQLTELEEKFKPLEEEYNQIMEEKRTQDRIRAMEQEALNKKIRAAIIIQSYWRGFKMRKGLFKKKGKKGKGKGKGKKKAK